MQAWKLEDWLKHHGIKGQKWGERRGPPYPLTAEAKSYKDKPPIDEVLAKSRTRDRIVEDAIRSGTVSIKINRELQIKHTFAGRVPGRSYLYGDLNYAQTLVDELSGTGEAKVDRNGNWVRKEAVVSAEILGVYIDYNGSEVESRAAMIIYSKTGTHIYPRKDDE